MSQTILDRQELLERLYKISQQPNLEAFTFNLMGMNDCRKFLEGRMIFGKPWYFVRHQASQALAFWSPNSLKAYLQAISNHAHKSNGK